MNVTMPRMWWAIFTGCLEAGFKELEAMELVKAYLTAMVYASAATQKRGEEDG